MKKFITLFLVLGSLFFAKSVNADRAQFVTVWAFSPPIADANRDVFLTFTVSGWTCEKWPISRKDDKLIAAIACTDDGVHYVGISATCSSSRENSSEASMILMKGKKIEGSTITGISCTTAKL